MIEGTRSLPTLEFHPLTPERWTELEALFGEEGARKGCWCMYWRLTPQQKGQQGEENKWALKGIVDSGKVPGILAYANGQSIAWCSIGPRETYPTLELNRTLKRVDDEPVWSVVCFFVAESFRRKGVMVPLLTAAVEYAKMHGAKIVEGYPIIQKAEKFSELGGCTGVESAYLKAGFVKVRRVGNRRIMRYLVKEQSEEGK